MSFSLNKPLCILGVGLPILIIASLYAVILGIALHDGLEWWAGIGIGGLVFIGIVTISIVICISINYPDTCRRHVASVIAALALILMCIFAMMLGLISDHHKMLNGVFVISMINCIILFVSSLVYGYCYIWPVEHDPIIIPTDV